MDTEKMKEKLEKASKEAKEETKARRERSVQGSHLLQPQKDEIARRGLVAEEKTSILKVTVAGKKSRAVNVALKGGRVDWSGYTVEHEAIIPISEEEAKEKHLGRVRGMLDFTKSDELVMAAFNLVLDELEKAPVEEPKPAKSPKAKKEAKAEETSTESLAEQPADETETKADETASA